MDYNKDLEYGAYAEPPRVYGGNTNGMGGLVTIANLLFAVVIIVALIRSQTSAVTAIIIGGIYYAATTIVALLIISGAFIEWMYARQYGRTERHRIDTQAQLYTVHNPSADLLQTPDAAAALAPPGMPQTPTYVSSLATPDTTRRDALAWAVTLYGRDGEPDPHKVNLKGGTEPPGRLKTAAPSNAEVKQYLLDRNVLLRVKNGYRLFLDRYPTAPSLQRLLK